MYINKGKGIQIFYFLEGHSIWEKKISKVKY